MPAIAARQTPSASHAAAPVAAGAIAAFDGLGTTVTVRRDQALFFEGDAARYCFKLLSGTVRSCKLLADGRRHIHQFLLPGDFVGLESGDSHRSTVEAVEDAILLRYPRRELEQLIDRQPDLGRRLLGLLRGDLSAAQAQLLLLGRKSAIERLASFLLSLAERRGEHGRVALPMTRNDIADHLGLTMETVSRVFSQLKTRGVIQLMPDGEVLIRRRDELEDIAEAA